MISDQLIQQRSLLRPRMTPRRTPRRPSTPSRGHISSENPLASARKRDIRYKRRTVTCERIYERGLRGICANPLAACGGHYGGLARGCGGLASRFIAEPLPFKCRETRSVCRVAGGCGGFSEFKPGKVTLRMQDLTETLGNPRLSDNRGSRSGAQARPRGAAR